MFDIICHTRYNTAMSNPAPSSVLHAAAMARRLSALALWFAALLGRILPGAARRSEQQAAWRYIEVTMARFADLLERLAAGEIEPEEPQRARPHPRKRPDSVIPRTPGSPRINARAPRTTAPARTASRPRQTPTIAHPSAHQSAAPKPNPQGEAHLFKKSVLAPSPNHAHFITIYQQNSWNKCFFFFFSK